MLCVEELSDDPIVLQRVPVKRAAQIAQIKEEAAAQLASLREQLEAEQETVVAALLRWLYCPWSQHFDPRQLFLFGQEGSAQLEYRPASFSVLVRPKFGYRRCDEEGYNPNIAVAPLPPQPKEKVLLELALLAYVVVCSLGDRNHPFIVDE